MIGRFNLFWLGAGGFLVLFCVNEIVAYHLAAVPLWLGGPLSYAGMVVGALVGVSIAVFLGVEEPVEGGTPAAAAAADEEGSEDDDGEADEVAPASKPGAAHDEGAAAS
jgi:hypothetical protein